MSRVALALFLLASCQKPTESPDRQAPAEPLSPLRYGRLPAMIGDGAIEPAYQNAAAHWHTATTAYASGDGQAAGDRFLDAASALTTSSVAPHGLAHRAARCIAYDNAASAYGPAACPRLEVFKTKDPGCRATIGKICARTSTTSDP